MQYKLKIQFKSSMLNVFVFLSGKSSLLSALGNREMPIPAHTDIFHLQREMAPSDKTALECVLEVDQEKHRLEVEAEELALRNTEGIIYITWIIYITCSAYFLE
jgi:hypothetical protein